LAALRAANHLLMFRIAAKTFIDRAAVGAGFEDLYLIVLSYLSKFRSTITTN
jgi:hypothetical protein